MSRNALITSAIALLLCVSMLVGATFAWFTDEVVSGRNTIAAGNLDIELYAGTQKVDANTVLFNNKTLWEPGVVVYENLQVANVGTLALKYQMTLNVYAENDLNGYKLSEVVKVALVDKIAEDATRAEVLAAAQDKGVALADFNLAGTLEAGNKSAEQAIVIYWAANENEIDNLYNANNGKETSDGEPLYIEFGITLQATQLMSENDSFGNDYDENTEIPVVAASAAELQAAVDNAADGDVIVLGANIEGHVTVTQKPNVAITIDGRGYNYQGTITVNGKSARYTTAGLTIMNVNFAGGASTGADAYVALGGTNAMRYIDNVTVKNCTFSGEGEAVVGVKSYTGGDHNVVIEGCVANKGMHSLAQLANVEKGLKIVDCEVYSKNGANLNNCLSLEMSGCTFDVTGYAVRFGSNGSANADAKTFQIANSTLKAACADGDAVIIFRATSTNATLNLVNTTVEGDVKVKGNTDATVINGL